MSCHPMLSLKDCPANVKRPMLIHTLVFGLLSLFTAVFFGVSVVRRWYHLRERMNTFWLISIAILLFAPSWMIYFITYLATINGKAPPQILMSITNWFGIITLGNTFAPLIAAWLQLTSRRLSSRRLKANWPMPLIVAQVLFLVGSFTGFVLDGWNKTYSAGQRIILGTCVAYLWVTIACLWYGARQIEQNIKTLAKGTKSRAADPEANRNDAITRVTTSLNRTLGFLVCGIFIPGSIDLLLHALFLDYIDRTIWATQLIWSAYRVFCLAAICYWGFTFWVETDYRVSSSGRGNTSTTNNNTSRNSRNDHPPASPMTTLSDQTQDTSPTPPSGDEAQIQVGNGDGSRSAKTKNESKADGLSM